MSMFRGFLLSLLALPSLCLSSPLEEDMSSAFAQLLSESKDAWRLFQYYDFRLGYDSNLNRSYDKPPEASNSETPSYYTNINFTTLRLFTANDTSVSLSLNGYYEGYTKYRKLNIANGNLTSRVAHFLSKQCMVGSSIAGHIHNQPYLQDYAKRLQATNFSNNGYELSPFVGLYPADDLSLFASYGYEYSKYKQARKDDLYPYTYKKQFVDLELKKKNDRWGSKIYLRGIRTQYEDLPSFNANGNISSSNPKERLLDRILMVSAWKNFPNIIPEVGVEFYNRKDKFEGYDTYYFYRPELIFSFSLPHEQYFRVQGSYEKRKYTQRSTLPAILISNSTPKVRYQIFTSDFSYEWEFRKSAKFFTSFFWEERKTNVEYLDYDRDYKQLVGTIGIKLSI